MGFMANSPSILDYGTNYKMIGEKMFSIAKCNICGKNSGRCKHTPNEILKDMEE